MTRLRQRGPGVTRCEARLSVTVRPCAVGGGRGVVSWAAVGLKVALGGKGGWRPTKHRVLSPFLLGYIFDANLNSNSNLNPLK
jgi:hypothetical protein